MPTPIFTLLVLLFPFACIVMGLIHYQKLFLQSKYIYFLSIFTFACRGGIILTFGAYNLGYAWIYNLIIAVEFLLIARSYQVAFEEFIPKQVLNVLMLLFSIFCFSCMLFPYSHNTLHTYPKVIESALSLILSILYFYKIFVEAKVEKLEKEPMFLISCAVLIYFSVEIFIFIFSNDMIRTNHYLTTSIEVMQGIFFMLFYGICLVAIWIDSRKI